ncbi:MAG: UDP-forming cellulose synthase catalytic subunit, partial [Acetobacteraceae bacterium]|nr:UDP-forming cellulose synthase catalytic subunit [Acetobacteraceae bacterium]
MKSSLRRPAGDSVRNYNLAHKILALLLAATGIAAIGAIATVPLSELEQTAFAICTVIAFLILNRKTGHRTTLFLVALSAAVSLRYIVWRVADTLDFSTTLQAALGIVLVLAEFYAVAVLALGYFQTAWPLERKPASLPEDPASWPAVDVYIPTYNEDLSVVRPTVLAALAIDWPRDKLRVYILDDGRRPEFRDFAMACGAGYIIRPDNKHAKAGNLNHALKQTDGDFIAIFDCDHIPTRAFLQMTMGWLVRDARMGAIQTPHHFYSPDPFQRNLAAGSRVPSEGNLFYGLLQDGNDLWNAAFFCGSCAVLRRAALKDIGGFATETVTEDAHTALRMHRAGWDSAYLRLPLAAGLATERLSLHVGQRKRWARGMIQILRTENPLFARGLKLSQRLCYLNATVHFLFAIPQLIFLISPLAYLLLGQNIIAASPAAIFAYVLPHMFHSIATNSRLYRNWRHSFWSLIYETVLALSLVRMTLVTLINPRRGTFNVTDKGGLLAKGYFDWRAVYPNLILGAFLVAGLGRGLYGLLFQQNDALTFEALLLNSTWVSLSLLIVLAALAVGRETRQVRANARVRAELPITVRFNSGEKMQGVTRNLSLGGCNAASSRPSEALDGAKVTVEFRMGEEILAIPAQIVRWEGDVMQAAWEPVTIADEGNIVRAVFGRADAWIDWDKYPVDRPIARLGRVLASIRGLFR